MLAASVQNGNLEGEDEEKEEEQSSKAAGEPAALRGGMVVGGLKLRCCFCLPVERACSYGAEEATRAG